MILALAAVCFLQTMILAAILTPVARREAVPLGLIDRPTLARKQHKTPIPRAGGLAIFAAFWAVFWVNFFLAGGLAPSLEFLPEAVRNLGANVWLKADQCAMLFVGCSMIFGVGFLDDRFNLPAKLRLGIQLLACAPLIGSGIVLNLFLPAFISWPLTIFWLVLLTNSLNFLDNMNGLTAGLAVLISLFFALVSGLSGEWFMVFLFAMLAGAALGFWFYNFPDASIFLGDSGSTHLGFLIAALTILATYYQDGVPSKLPILIPLVILGIPLFDTFSVLWIRWRAGKPFMEGDTNHLSHRLVSLGMSRREAVLYIYGGSVVLGLMALGLRRLDWAHGVFQALAIILIFLLLHWLERVSYRERTGISS